MTNEHMVRHLEMIQGVIGRLAGNSFAYKGWAITIVTGIFVLSAKTTDWRYLLSALVPTLAFWGLDSYYLRQERLYRALYNQVRTMSAELWASDHFSMDTRSARHEVASWWRVCWSRTIAPLYGPMALLIIAVAVIAWIC
jgi:hypothetical protein